MFIPSKLSVIILVAIGFLCWPMKVMAASDTREESPVSLIALINEALEKNPELLLWKHRWQAAKEKIPQAQSLDDPQLTITQWEIPSNFNIGNANGTWYGIGQYFPFPGKRSLRSQVATKHAAVAEQDYHAKAREITARVKDAYFQQFLIQKSIALLIEHQALLTEFIRIANKKYAVGQTGQQEALHAQVELSKLHNRLLILKQEELVNTAELNTLTNRPMEWPLGTVPMLEHRPFSLTFEELTQQAARERPELKATELMVEKSQQARHLADKNNLPDFMIEVMHWDVHQGANAWQANFKINLPWVFREKYAASLRQAEAEEAQARANLLTLYNQTMFELKGLFTRIKTAEQLILVYQGGVLPQAEQSLKAARIGYQAGKISFLNLIESERTLRDLQLEYYTTLVEYEKNRAKLERVGGVAKGEDQ